MSPFIQTDVEIKTATEGGNKLGLSPLPTTVFSRIISLSLSLTQTNIHLSFYPT